MLDVVNIHVGPFLEGHMADDWHNLLNRHHAAPDAPPVRNAIDGRCISVLSALIPSAMPTARCARTGHRSTAMVNHTCARVGSSATTA